MPNEFGLLFAIPIVVFLVYWLREKIAWYIHNNTMEKDDD